MASSDVTTSVRVSLKSRRGAAAGEKSGPYLEVFSLSEMAHYALPKGRLSGAAITATGGVVTVPSGSVFVLPLGGTEKLLVTLQSALTLAVEEDDFIWLRAQGADAVYLESGAAAPANVLVLGQGLNGPVDTVDPDPSLDVKLPKRIVLTLTGFGVSSGTSQWLVSPVGGRIKRVRTVTTTVVDADTVVGIELANVDVTGSNVTLTASGAAIGDVDDSGEIADSASNVVEAGQAIEVTSDGAGTAGVVNLQVEVEPD